MEEQEAEAYEELVRQLMNLNGNLNSQPVVETVNRKLKVSSLSFSTTLLFIFDC